MRVDRKKGSWARRSVRWRLLAVPFACLGAVLSFVIPATAASAAATKLELIAQHGPTNVPLLATIDEQDEILLEGSGEAPNAGRFFVGVSPGEGGKVQRTKPLALNTTAAQLKVALEELAIVGSGGVEVEGGRTSPEQIEWSFVITFVGPNAGLEFIVESEELEPTGAEEKAILAEEGEVEELLAESEQLHLPSRDTANFHLYVNNPSATATKSPITIVDNLPEGFVTADEVEPEFWKCTKGVHLTTVECTYKNPVGADSFAVNFNIEALVEIDKLHDGQDLTNEATLSWEKGAQSTTVTDTIPISSEDALFGIDYFEAASYSASGEKDTVAGDHPYAATTTFLFNNRSHFSPAEERYEIVTPGKLKDADVILPEGFLGNPAKRTRCTQAELTIGDIGAPESGNPSGGCPIETQVGVATVFFKEFSYEGEHVPVYNLVPPRGVPAEFGFVVDKEIPVRIDAHVRRLNGKYRVTVLSPDVNEALNVNGLSLSLWGVPGDSSHDPERTQTNHLLKGAVDPELQPFKPFLTNPTDCKQQAEEAPFTAIYYDSWENQGVTDSHGEPELNGSGWKLKTAVAPPVTGCGALTFSPEVEFQPRKPNGAAPLASGSRQVGAPSGYEFELTSPQVEEVGKLATPQLKDTTVSLPPGVSLSPSAANGLVACTEQQIELDSPRRGNCPEASQVGEVRITSPLLEKSGKTEGERSNEEGELNGRVYVGQPACSPCSGAQVAKGELVKLYIEAESEEAGVRVKLPGSASVDQATGVVTSSFLNNPQVPFTRLTLTLKGGPRASLANPQLCGTYSSDIVLTPWSFTEELSGGQVLGSVTKEPSFDVDWNGGEGEGNEEGCPASLPFAPSFASGTQSSKAGAYSEFDTVFSRNDDREQAFSSDAGIVVHTPTGLLGKIAGVSKCEGEKLASLEAGGECPANSVIATAISKAGPGPAPYEAIGKVYLTGPYTSPTTGASGPFGLAIAVPAKAGPFNLGTVVVRAAISIDPRTSAITITSDPLPLSKDGIPLRVQQIEVAVDRSEFMFNPTSCDAKSITASLAGEAVKEGEAAGVENVSAPFQASDCGALPFAPKFTATAAGDYTKKEGTSFKVTVDARPGDANIGKVELQLPEHLPSRLETLQNACLAKTFEENPAKCSPLAVVGSATAHTPLLNAPVTGPAYLVSHGGEKFPDLVFLLQGEGVEIELVGHTDIKKGITYSRFESVPDAPITSFETVFPRGTDSILGAFGNICELELNAPTTVIAQNNKRFEQETHIGVTGCPPTVKIAKVVVSGNALIVSVKTSSGGTITVAGSGLKTTKATGIKNGTKQIKVPLTKAGLKAKAHKHKLKLKVTVTAGGKSSTKTASVKA
ncbi:MAG TPA: hypothetical protein VGG08_07905 [Solirubrobacteraceae bacterium]